MSVASLIERERQNNLLEARERRNLEMQKQQRMEIERETCLNNNQMDVDLCHDKVGNQRQLSPNMIKNERMDITKRISPGKCIRYNLYRIAINIILFIKNISMTINY